MKRGRNWLILRAQPGLTLITTPGLFENSNMVLSEEKRVESALPAMRHLPVGTVIPMHRTLISKVLETPRASETASNFTSSQDRLTREVVFSVIRIPSDPVTNVIHERRYPSGIKMPRIFYTDGRN
jgi:hypothetical protein